MTEHQSRHGCLDSKPFPHFPGFRPFIAGYPIDQFRHYPGKGHLKHFFGQRSGAVCGKQRAHVREEGRRDKFLEHALLRFGARDRNAGLFQIERGAPWAAGTRFRPFSPHHRELSELGWLRLFHAAIFAGIGKIY